MLERLRLFRKTIGYEQKEIASVLGIKENTYCQIENGRRELTSRHIDSLVNKLHLNKDWLLTGEGDMFITTSDEEDLLRRFRELTPESKEYCLKHIRFLKYLEQGDPDRQSSDGA